MTQLRTISATFRTDDVWYVFVDAHIYKKESCRKFIEKYDEKRDDIIFFPLPLETTPQSVLSEYDGGIVVGTRLIKTGNQAKSRLRHISIAATYRKRDIKVAVRQMGKEIKKWGKKGKSVKTLPSKKQITRSPVKVEPIVLGKVRKPKGADKFKECVNKLKAALIEPPEVSPKEKTIIIVGAGISGLLSGRLLQLLGYTVRILEFHERVGGRILTHRFKNPKRQPNVAPCGKEVSTVLDEADLRPYGEAGAMRFSKTNHKLTHWLVDEVYRLPIKEFEIGKKGDSKTWYVVNDRLWKKENVKLNDDPFLKQLYSPPITINGILEQVLEEPKRLYRLYPRDEALKLLIERYDHHSISSYLNTQGLDDAAIKMMANFWGIGGRLQSGFVEWFLHNIMGHYEDLFYVKGGSERLISKLVEQICADDKDAIMCQRHVTHVEQEKDGVEVFFHPHDDSKPPYTSIKGSKVIITAPLPRAKMIQMDGIHFGKHISAIDWRKRYAMQYATSGEAIKILTVYKNAFWKQNFDVGQVYMHNGIGALVIPKAGQDKNNKQWVAILNYAWGTDAIRSFLDKDEQVKYIRRAIQSFFPSEAKAFNADDNATEVFNWSHLAGGIGPIFAPDELSNGTFHDLLRHTGNIYFAGDAQSVYFRRWVEGAVRSAFRVVAAIDEQRDDFLTRIDEPWESP